MNKIFKLFSIFVLIAGPTFAQTEDADKKWLIESGVGISRGNIYVNLTGDENVPATEPIVWGRIGRQNWLASGNVRFDRLKIDGYSIKVSLNGLSTRYLNSGISIGYSERNPLLVIGYSKIRVEETDRKKTAFFSVEAGRGSFNGNNFRAYATVVYGTSAKTAVIFADNILINGGMNTIYENIFYKSEVFMSGGGMSGQLMTDRLTLSGSAEYLSVMTGPTFVLPNNNLFAEGNLSFRVISKIYISAGGFYSDNPYGLRGSSYAYSGLSVKF